MKLMALPQHSVTPEETISDGVWDANKAYKEAQGCYVLYAISIGKKILKVEEACKASGTSFRSLFADGGGHDRHPTFSFSRKVAQQFRDIAKNAGLADCKKPELLPSDYNTLSLLARLEPTKLTEYIEAGTVNAKTKRADAAKLVNEKTTSKKKKSKPPAGDPNGLDDSYESLRSFLMKMPKGPRAEAIKNLAYDCGCGEILK